MCPGHRRRPRFRPGNLAAARRRGRQGGGQLPSVTKATPSRSLTRSRVGVDRLLPSEPMSAKRKVSTGCSRSSAPNAAQLNIVVANAAFGVPGTLYDATAKHWDVTLAASARSLLDMTKRAVPMMNGFGGSSALLPTAASGSFPAMAWSARPKRRLNRLHAAWRWSSPRREFSSTAFWPAWPIPNPRAPFPGPTECLGMPNSIRRADGWSRRTMSPG